MIPNKPEKISDKKFRFDSFANGLAFSGNKKGRLPAMGWNSWNAFGSGNTEKLTKLMADKLVELGLDKLGYKYLVLDDGCYKSEREEGKLANEAVKFPNGFKALSDYIHAKGLKFGMYNDIGTNLCAGAAVGTCGFEKIDAKAYIDWGVDFLKIDNCYYLWDNATFSNPENARYVFAPNIKAIEIKKINDIEENSLKLPASQGKLCGAGASVKNDYVTGLGTFDGTNTGVSPVGPMSSELHFEFDAPQDGTYELKVTYASGRENGCGEWLQLACEQEGNYEIFYDDFLPASPSPETFMESQAIKITLKKGSNIIRLMNHRRQENTLCSYAAMLQGLNEAKPDHEVLLSLCEWGKTQPQNWGYKVGNSWRILNDITFRVGRDGDAGYGEWIDPGTPSVTSQYNKAVIMDEFSGLEKGWNDPDMLMIGMNGLTRQMNETHFTMWCMMNSPLMLGLDLRRVKKGDELYNIIANSALIALNQDALGIQAKRILSTIQTEEAPDKAYITDCDRVDILAKPLSDGSLALCFINLSESKKDEKFQVSLDLIKKYLGKKLPQSFYAAKAFDIENLWTGQKESLNRENDFSTAFSVNGLEACGNKTFKITAR